MADDPTEVASGNNFSSSEDFGSDAGHEASSAVTPICDTSPGFGNLSKGKIQDTGIGVEEVGEPFATVLNLKERQDSSWLDIDDFPDSYLVFEDSAVVDKCQETGDI